jgi:SAM-dependent methyltransferase
MAPPDLFPLTYPADVRPALAAESQLRRIAGTSDLEPGSKVLVLGALNAAAAQILAKEFSARVVVADTSEAALARLGEVLDETGVSHAVSRRKADFDALPFEDGEFSAIFVDPVPLLPFERAVNALRPLLAKSGRLVLGYPVLVSRHPAPGSVQLWEQKLGEKLLSPREYLQILERSGYEPQTLETLDDAALDDFYLSLEKALGGSDPAVVREEISLHRSQSGRATVSFSMFVGRRKEPGEPPPISRNE